MLPANVTPCPEGKPLLPLDDPGRLLGLGLGPRLTRAWARARASLGLKLGLG